MPAATGAPTFDQHVNQSLFEKNMAKVIVLQTVLGFEIRVSPEMAKFN